MGLSSRSWPTVSGSNSLTDGRDLLLAQFALYRILSVYVPSSTSTRSLLLGIWGHLSRRRRLQLALLLVVMLFSAVAELLSLGAVLPFLAVLSDPEQLWQKPSVQPLVNWLSLTQASQLMLPVTMVFAAMAVLAAVIRLANLWLNGQLAAAVGSDLSCEAYRRTLYQPYGVHVQRNSSVVITGVTTQINGTIVALSALLQLISSAVAALGVFTGLLLLNWIVAITAALLFGSVYGLLGLKTRRELRVNGEKIALAAKQQLKALQEGLGAIRDVLLDGSQPMYLAMYAQAEGPQRKLVARNQYIGTFPRYALEALGMVAIAIAGALLALKGSGPGAVIPLLGVIALSAQRLLPMLQQIFGSWAALKGCDASLNDVLMMLEQPLIDTPKISSPLQFCQSLRFEDVHFRYSPDLPYVLSNLCFEIAKGARIGIIGSTGSGKSSTVDLLMGLLVPTHGRVLVDGEDIHDPNYPERLLAWRAAIAHVPQSIYLADSSIAENIAFGVPTNEIDMNRVHLAAVQAQVASYIDSTPQGYLTAVGERGVFLSGGQRQRIGIARALYKQASVLIFDEATSALDDGTEQAVVEAINNLSKELTLIMIAHRLDTVRRCDRLIRLEQGVLFADGPPQVVLAGFCQNSNALS